jgi:hypothetical protein
MIGKGGNNSNVESNSLFIDAIPEFLRPRLALFKYLPGCPVLTWMDSRPECFVMMESV